MARLLLLPWLFLLPFVHPQLHSDPAFLKFADYSDIEDLLLLAEENVRMPSWIGESRDKQSASAAAGPPQFGPRFKPRQYGISTFELAKRKRRSEGRFPVAGVFKSADPTPVSHTAPLHSGRIFPSPRIFQRFKPREVAPGQLRVEASSVAGEFPEWLALHAGRRGPIRAKSYRELLLHALNRAQVELSRRHRVHWAGPVPPEEQRLPRGRTLVDGESPSTAPKKGSQPLRDRADDKEKAGEGQLCRDCFAHWRALDATKAMSDWEVAERCCPGKRPPRQQRIGQSKAKEKWKKSGKEGGGRRRDEAKSSATATAAGSGKGDGKEAKDRRDGNANADGKISTSLAPTG